MLNCITPMAESRGMCLRTAGLISYTALKQEGCFLCPHSLETQGCMAAVRSPAPSPPRLSQDRGVCSCQGSRSPLFPESLGDEADKRGNAPPPPPRALRQGAKRKCPPHSSPPLLQQDCLPALEDTMHTDHSSLHQHTGAIHVPKGGYCQPCCSPCLPNAQNSNEMLSNSSGMKQTDPAQLLPDRHFG